MSLEQDLELVANVEALAAKKGVTPGQLAMAWLLAQAPDVIPAPGTKRVSALEENVGAAGVGLSPEESPCCCRTEHSYEARTSWFAVAEGQQTSLLLA
jgi:aryl-alcohol dehydrogenase-like predicted oxidoreductase